MLAYSQQKNTGNRLKLPGALASFLELPSMLPGPCQIPTTAPTPEQIPTKVKVAVAEESAHLGKWSKLGQCTASEWGEGGHHWYSWSQWIGMYLGPEWHGGIVPASAPAHTGCPLQPLFPALFPSEAKVSLLGGERAHI